MSSKPNKLFQFWLELKRRKVIKVIAMYAGVAFVLLELTNNVIEPLNLPEWTPRLVILIAIIGFPITAVLSWIFDLTPEGFSKTEAISDTETEILPEASQRKFKASDAIISVLVVVICVLIYPKIFNKDPFAELRDEDGKISVAVMPFENLTGDTTLNWVQRGIPSMLINGLGNSPELKVSDEHTMFDVMESLGQPFTTALSLPRGREVAEQAQAETYISGSYLGGGDTYWILANLVDTRSGNILWTNKIEGNLESSNYRVLVDSLCNQVKDYLEIQVLKKNLDYDFHELFPESSEAFKYYVEGMNRFLARDLKSSIQLLEKALSIDSTFTIASFYLAWSYYWEHRQFTLGNKWMLKAMANIDNLPLNYQHWLQVWHAYFIAKDGDEIIRYCDLLMESGMKSGMKSRLLWSDLGATYSETSDQLEKVIQAYENVERLNEERGSPFKYELFYPSYGWALHKTGNHKKENELYEVGLSLFPSSILINSRQSGCALSRGDTTYLSSFVAAMKSEGINDIEIQDHAAFVYNYAKLYNEAAEVLKELDKTVPNDQWVMIHLARTLIKYEVGVEEGIEMTNKLLAGFIIWSGLEVREDMDLFKQVLEIEMQDRIAEFMAEVFYLKGLGLQKLGKDQEALIYLETAMEVYPPYFHTCYLALQEVRQALSVQNNK